MSEPVVTAPLCILCGGTLERFDWHKPPKHLEIEDCIETLNLKIELLIKDIRRAIQVAGGKPR